MIVSSDVTDDLTILLLFSEELRLHESSLSSGTNLLLLLCKVLLSSKLLLAGS